MDESAPYAYYEDVNWGLLRLWGTRRNLDVLDVGCGFATTPQHIRAAGNRVTGIESSPVAVQKARERIDRVVEADLQNFDEVLAAIGDERFDVIIFADVLEHLAWPVGILKKYIGLLKPGGSVIVSLPNVGLWSVRLGLMFGRFRYDESGVLDRTHLRFFTRRTAEDMMRSAGLKTVRRTYNPGLVRPFVPLVKAWFREPSPRERAEGARRADEGSQAAAILESRSYRLYLKTVYPVERAIARVAPGLLAFQMIFEARLA